MSPSAITSLVEDGDIDHIDTEAVMFRNAGTATVEMWNGLWTLDPKETLSLNVTNEGTTLDLNNIPVKFDTSSGGVKKLQILLIKSKIC